MTITIPDNVAKEAGLTEPRQAQIEIACWLFDAERLDLWPAAQVAGLSRVEFEAELHRRDIAIYRPTLEDIRQDIENMRQLREIRERASA
jgi:predicted HTH domain antitoxin